MNNLLIGIRLASIKKAKEKFADEHSRELKSCHATRRQVKDYLNEKGEFDKDRVEWKRDKAILTQKNRNGNNAYLICAGRRIRKREMQLRYENVHWDLLVDSLGAPDHSLPEELQKLVAFVRSVGMKRDASDKVGGVLKGAV